MRALITGASSGIGRALAYLLAKKGIALTLSGRNSEKLHRIAADIGAENVIIANLSHPAEYQKLIEFIEAQTPALVINNAGFGIYGDVFSISPSQQMEIVQVNALAPTQITLAAINALKKKNREGIIMNVSSVAGEFPCPGMAAYGASKSFLTHFSQSLNFELSNYGIHVLVSCPGMVSTEFSNRAAGKKVEIGGGPTMSAEFAAEQIWKQILKKQEKHIFNWQYRVGSWVANKLIPVSFVKTIIWKKIRKRL